MALWRWLILIILAVGTGCTDDQPLIKRTALQGVTIIDGGGNTPLSDQVVVLRDDRIEKIIAADVYSPDPGTIVHELQGHFVIPGLIDMHAHVSILSLESLAQPEPDADHETSKRVLKILLAHGITTVRNPAAPTEDGISLRDSVASGAFPGPRIFTSGYVLNRRTFGPYLNMRTADAVRAEISHQADAGVDYIKVYAALPSDLVETAIEAAHGHGLKVVGHLQRTTWTEAARMGIDAITHGSPWSRSYLPAARQKDYIPTLKGRIYWLQNLDLQAPAILEMVEALVENDVTIDPTIIAYHTKFWGDDARYRNHPDLGLTPPVIREVWRASDFTSDWTAKDFIDARAVWPKLKEFIKLLYDRGVLLTAGSDLPNPWVIPGVSLHEELALLTDLGISPLEVLKIATHNGAVALGIDADTGMVEVGKRADILVLTEDPLKDIRNTRSIKWTIKSGVIMEPSLLLQEN